MFVSCGQWLIVSGLCALNFVCKLAEAPLRGRTQAPFMFSVDHCFPIKGQGTVMTGTVLSGTVQIHDVRTFRSRTS